MQLIRDYTHIQKPIESSVVTLGNFDGIHLGHQALLSEFKRQGQVHDAKTVAITFEPQPKEFFSKTPLVPRLMLLREKYMALLPYHLDYLLCLRFNLMLANLSPEAFVNNILVEKLGVKAVIVGEDFRFGAKRAGDVSTLKRLSEEFGFDCIVVSDVMRNGRRISSTRVREALQAGDMIKAKALLGRPYSLCGKVAYGDQLGRKLGFPTANIRLYRALLPLTGIFVVEVFGLEKQYFGAANVGVRPTVGGTRVLLEVYIFDFNNNIYQKNLRVDFLHKLRDEARYDSLSALAAQIKQDVVDAKLYLTQN